jgi:hypothetical protein
MSTCPQGPGSGRLPGREEAADGEAHDTGMSVHALAVSRTVRNLCIRCIQARPVPSTKKRAKPDTAARERVAIPDSHHKLRTQAAAATPTPTCVRALCMPREGPRRPRPRVSGPCACHGREKGDIHRHTTACTRNRNTEHCLGPPPRAQASCCLRPRRRPAPPRAQASCCLRLSGRRLGVHTGCSCSALACPGPRQPSPHKPCIHVPQDGQESPWQHAAGQQERSQA